MVAYRDLYQVVDDESALGGPQTDSVARADAAAALRELHESAERRREKLDALRRPQQGAQPTSTADRLEELRLRRQAGQQPPEPAEESPRGPDRGGPTL